MGAPFTGGGFDQEGSAYLVRGPVAGNVDLSVAHARIKGADKEEYLGRGLAWAGDVDGDGYDDLLVGAKGSDAGFQNGGAVYLFSGGPGM